MMDSQWKAINAAYYTAHREERRVTNAAYYAAHREERKAYSVARRVSHREAWRGYASRYRARKFGNGGSHSVAEWRDKLALFGYCCAYCGKTKPLERDHKISLIRGGTDDIANIVPACQSCNCSKSARTATEFIRERLTR